MDFTNVLISTKAFHGCPLYFSDFSSRSFLFEIHQDEQICNDDYSLIGKLTKPKYFPQTRRNLIFLQCKKIGDS